MNKKSAVSKDKNTIAYLPLHAGVHYVPHLKAFFVAGGIKSAETLITERTIQHKETYVDEVHLVRIVSKPEMEIDGEDDNLDTTDYKCIVTTVGLLRVPITFRGGKAITYDLCGQMSPWVRFIPVPLSKAGQMKEENTEENAGWLLAGHGLRCNVTVRNMSCLILKK